MLARRHVPASRRPLACAGAGGSLRLFVSVHRCESMDKHGGHGRSSAYSYNFTGREGNIMRHMETHGQTWAHTHAHMHGLICRQTHGQTRMSTQMHKTKWRPQLPRITRVCPDRSGTDPDRSGASVCHEGVSRWTSTQHTWSTTAPGLHLDGAMCGKLVLYLI